MDQSRDRRTFIKVGMAGTFGLAHALTPRRAPAFVRRDESRPGIPCGVASGDVSADSGVVWSRTDRPGRMIVEWSTRASFQDARTVVGPATLPEDDFTARVLLTNLPPGQTIVYRVSFQDLSEPKVRSAPVSGQFRTRAREAQRVRLAWSGDTAGQGWGIDVARGGMLTYASILAHDPDLFVHSGDHIYADNPLAAEVALEDGSLWRNVVTEGKSKVAETLDEFRANYRYNLMDEHVRALNARVPMLAQWDDHETRNNWYPGQMIEDERYSVRSLDLLAARAKRAFLDYMPMRRAGRDFERIQRVLPQGPLLDVFMLDARTYRGPNSSNRQTERGVETAFLGAEQLDRLKRRLKASRARWKLMACDMPLGLVVGDGPGRYEAVANGEGGAPLGRELEIAELLRFLKTERIRNVVWITADVHYAAAHRYDPARAVWSEFDPFWEFVAGPLHAGTFGPGRLDGTFGPELKFCALPAGMKPNRPPSDGLQFYGLIDIDPTTEVITVSLHDRAGKELYAVDLEPFLA